MANVTLLEEDWEVKRTGRVIMRKNLKQTKMYSEIVKYGIMVRKSTETIKLIRDEEKGGNGY